MTFEVRLVFRDDGSSELALDCDTLHRAAAAAFRIADDHGQPGAHPRPVGWVNVYRDARLELSVQVIEGGLIAPRYRPRSQPR